MPEMLPPPGQNVSISELLEYKSEGRENVVDLPIEEECRQVSASVISGIESGGVNIPLAYEFGKLLQSIPNVPPRAYEKDSGRQFSGREVVHHHIQEMNEYLKSLSNYDRIFFLDEADLLSSQVTLVSDNLLKAVIDRQIQTGKEKVTDEEVAEVVSSRIQEAGRSQVVNTILGKTEPIRLSPKAVETWAGKFRDAFVVWHCGEQVLDELEKYKIKS